MTPAALTTPEEYFARDATAEGRCEYWHGQIVAMAGETPRHSAVKDNVVAALREGLPHCTARTSGLRVRAPGYGRTHYAYPDGIVVCGEERFDTTTSPPTLLNPLLLIEVTSDSTRSRDLADKLDAYFGLDSLAEYWIIDPDHPYVLAYQRAAPGVLVQFVRGLDAVLQSKVLGVSIPLATIYRRVL